MEGETIVMESALVEQVVKKEKDVKYYLNILLIILGAIGIPMFLVVLALLIDLHYLVVVAFFALLFCIYGAWFFISSLKVDYEYSCLGNTMRFDKVIAKRRRKPIIRIDLKSVTDFFPYSDEEMSKRRIGRVYRASAREFSEENYVLVFRSDERGKRVVIFTPNEKIIEAMKPHFSAELKKKLYFGKKS